MKIVVPDVLPALKIIDGVQAAYAGQVHTIEAYRKEYLASVQANRQRAPIAIFNIFVASLLERAMRGEAYDKRIAAFNDAFKDYSDVTDDGVTSVLKKTGYRFPTQGKSTVIAARDIAASPGFAWHDYLTEADGRYLDNFQDDRFLDVKYVANKTRDLALSAFSTRFVAVDIHVTRVAMRTGFFLYGYADPTHGVEETYAFLRSAVIRMSQETGWPATGYSPSEVDRAFLHFGRTVCSATPRCTTCPLAGQCLTARQRSVALDA